MELIPDLLLEVGKLCHQMKENEDLCLQLHESATLFWNYVEAMTQDVKESKQRVIHRYKRTLLKILKTLRKHHERGLFIRIWGNHLVVGKLTRLFNKLDDLYKVMGLESFQTVEKIHVIVEKSQEDLKNCAENVAAIQATLNEDGYKEGVVALGVLSRFTDGSTNAQDIPPEQVERAKRTFERAAALMKQRKEELPLIPKWFIPRDAVEFNDDTFLDRGAYAMAYVGWWGQHGLGTEVVVKCLLADNEQAQEEFTHVWRIHVGDPIFFVCEHVKGGNFVTLFEKDKSQLWRLFYSAALGLRYLHENKIVHGDLKCNNILVDGDTAKICDFGFSYVRARSDMSRQAQTTQIRWKAPEALMPLDSNINPRFASDVFSFGMCIVEAFLDGEVPYGTEDDDTIIEKILEGEQYSRPRGIKDDEWALVLRLCEYNWEARLTIADALRTLKMFADREAAAGGQQAPSLECSKCKITLPAEAVACWKCGSSMADN